MQFFSQFDGNNILFIVGLLLVILPFYEIEGKGFKLHTRMEKKLEQEYETAGSTFNQGAKNEIQIADISFIQKTKDIEDGSPINGSTSKHEMMDMKDKIQDDDSMLKYKAKSQHPEHPDLTELDKGDAQ